MLREEDRDVDPMEDQQFHVLPLYVPDCSKDELEKNVANGGLTILNKNVRPLQRYWTPDLHCLWMSHLEMSN